MAGEGDRFCTLGVKHSWNWRGQPEVDSKFPLIVRERHSQKRATLRTTQQNKLNLIKLVKLK